MKTPRRLFATSVAALLLAAPAAGLASSASAATGAAPAAASARAASTPVAAVKSFAASLDKANGKAACKVMTKGYQRKVIKAAVQAGAPAGTTCVTVMEELGKQVKANGGIPAFTLKVVKQSGSTAVVRFTYKKVDLTGTYTTKRIGGSWLIADASPVKKS